MAVRWRFIESDEDGAAWLESPNDLTAWVEYESADDSGVVRTLRTMVVTRGWLDRHLAGVHESTTGPLFACFPALAVMPDATGEKLRMFVDRAIQDRLCSEFATIV